MQKPTPSDSIKSGVFVLGRKPRFEYPGGIYHLIQRGNNKEFIFEEKEDKKYLLELIREYKEIMEFDLYGYVIMGNHYHLVIRTSATPLSDIMHRINNKFSRYYNRKNKRSGHVFGDRYKGILVMDISYLLRLLRYVHQNPVSANICKNTNDYIWSSDRCYRLNDLDEMVDIDFILNMLSKNRKHAIEAYHKFMDDNQKEDIAVFETVDIIGEVNPIRPNSYIEKEKISLEEILLEVTGDEEIFNEIKSGSRKRYLSNYKKQFIELAIKANYTMKEIGDSISISDAAISKIHNSNVPGT